MAYTRKTWECGDVVTAEALNNLEGGVAEALECCGSGGGSDTLEVTFTWDENVGEGEWVCNHTYAEILSALQNGQKIVAYAINVEWLYQETLGSIEKIEDEEIIAFGTFSRDTSGNVVVIFRLSSDGNIQHGTIPVA